MTKKIKDNSPRFDRHKYYAIGTLQGNATPADVPERFSNSPVKPLYLSGTDLVGAGMKSCRDFLVSKNCHFRVGSAVHFYEIEYQENNEPPVYKNIFIGSPLPQSTALSEQGLSEKTADGLPVINNIIPNYHTTEYEKLFFKTQSEAIAYYQKCLQDERKQFADERNILTEKLQEKNDEILSLNLQINTLKSENEGLKIKYEEANKYADRIASMTQKEEEAPQGLADKGIAMLDGMLGDGAGIRILESIAMGLSSGIGKGVDKLIGLGVDYAREKGVVKTPQIPEQVEINN